MEMEKKNSDGEVEFFGGASITIKIDADRVVKKNKQKAPFFASKFIRFLSSGTSSDMIYT